jgi:hypothetical protein
LSRVPTTRHEPDWKKEWRQHRREATTVRLVKCSEKKKEEKAERTRERKKSDPKRWSLCGMVTTYSFLRSLPFLVEEYPPSPWGRPLGIVLNLSASTLRRPTLYSSTQEESGLV